MTDLHLRITHPHITHIQIAEIISPYCDRYIVAEEMANKKHFHAFLRYLLVEPKYNTLRHALTTIGIKGNKMLSISKRRTPNLEPYVCKQKDIVYAGFTEEEIQEIAARSYEKPKSYKVRKKELADAYLKNEITKEEFVRSLMWLMGDFNIEYYQHKLVAYVKTIQMKKSPSYLEKEINDVMKKI